MLCMRKCAVFKGDARPDKSKAEIAAAADGKHERRILKDII